MAGRFTWHFSPAYLCFGAPAQQPLLLKGWKCQDLAPSSAVPSAAPQDGRACSISRWRENISSAKRRSGSPSSSCVLHRLPAAGFCPGFVHVLSRFCPGFVELSTLRAAAELPLTRGEIPAKCQIQGACEDTGGAQVLVWILPNLHLHVPPIKIFPPQSFWLFWVVCFYFSSVKCLKLGIFQGKGIPTHHQSLSCLLWNSEIPKFSAAALLSLCLFFHSCQELNLEGTKHSCEWKWCRRLEE